MKTLLLISAIFLCILHPSLAQKNSHRSLKLHKVWVSIIDNPEKKKGVLFEIKDSSILLSNSYRLDDYLLSNFEVTKVDVRNIDAIRIRKTIHIHGSQQQFNQEKQKLSSYSLINFPVKEHKTRYSFSHLQGTILDIDGNVYQTVTLGGQVWLAENLKVTHFSNGKEIPCVKDNSSWVSVPSAAYCNYRNDAGYADEYGRLYNYQAVRDNEGLCPAGWHIPSFTEWTSLINLLRGYNNAGGYLKETGNSHWQNPNVTFHANNTFALPGGGRDRNGAFSEPGHICQWWLANGNDTENIQGLSLRNESTGIKIFTPDKNSGLSVRCIRD